MHMLKSKRAIISIRPSLLMREMVYAFDFSANLA